MGVSSLWGRAQLRPFFPLREHEKITFTIWKAFGKIQSMDKASEERIRNTIPLLDERQKRLYLANEAKAIGYGGISQVSKVSGVSRVTITQGMPDKTMLCW